MTLVPEIDGERLLGRLDAFARIGATRAGGVNRQAFSIEDRSARRLLAELALERGFAVFQDAMANLFIRREGTDATLPPLLIGSHLDSQPTGGRFDGALGTLSAFETLEAVEDAKAETRMPIEVVAWANEEGSRFAPGVMGSMAFTGADISAWQSIVGSDGASLAEELAATISALPEATLRPLGMPVSGFIELHIEQGPSLEKEGLPIGIVTAVQGTRWLEVSIEGAAGHAGTTDLAYRRDPMVAAVAAMHRLQTTVMPFDSSARLTVGRVTAKPGSINAIPQSVVFAVDIRHPQVERLDAIEAELRQVCAAEAEAQHCTAMIRRSFDMPGAAFSPDMVKTVEEAVNSLRLPHKQMISGAFHDALFLARVAPAAMIFVPCRDGLSHNEAEYVEPAYAITGARVLLQAAIAAASRR
ncbi:Zn-dependent hydrolase [Mesorhizobium sp. M0051]|uniref:Zn-dependent hydrolase n=1 Tax=unclassified Mesorhizobium TaxID=325217 RepID=UPI0003CE1018|nr:Zn-dependent hydrolase [Mesorhizobium sp. LNHC252B00]ESY71478.1 allantoate amidohydrolase [Mesorhizobium sp. LNHC252B00]